MQFAKEEVECVCFVWHDADKTGATIVFIFIKDNFGQMGGGGGVEAKAK